MSNIFDESKFPVGVMVVDGKIYMRSPKDGFPTVYIPKKPEDLEEVARLVRSIYDYNRMPSWTSSIEAHVDDEIKALLKISNRVSILTVKDTKDREPNENRTAGSVWIQRNKVYRWDPGAAIQVYTPKFPVVIYQVLTRVHHLQMMKVHPENTPGFKEMFKLETGLLKKLCSSIRTVK